MQMQKKKKVKKSQKKGVSIFGDCEVNFDSTINIFWPKDAQECADEKLGSLC